MISSIPPWQLKQPISYTRFDSKNKNPFQETFENIKDQYSDYECIYTDASKDEDLVGSAAIYGSKECTKRLSRTSSIYTAIDMALDIIKNGRSNKFMICTDSKSVLEALQNKKYEQPASCPT